MDKKTKITNLSGVDVAELAQEVILPAIKRVNSDIKEIATEVIKLKQDVDTISSDTEEKIAREISKIDAKITDAKMAMPKVVKGEPGKPGKDGKDGKDGKSLSVLDVIDELKNDESFLISLKGKDGTNATVTKEEVISILNKEEGVVEPKVIKGLIPMLTQLANQASGAPMQKVSGSILEVLNSGSSVMQGATRLNFVGGTVTYNKGTLDISFSGGGITLRTNGTNNGSQTVLNLKAGTNVTLADDGIGGVTISAAGGSGSGTVTSVTSATADATVATSTTTPVITIVSAPKLTTPRTIGTITGDATSAGSSFDGSANNTNTLTLATVNANVGSFTNASVTVNAKGLVTAASSGTAPVTSVAATGPITSSGGLTPTISTSMATNKLIGRGTAGTGVMEEITLGTNLSLTGTTLNASGGSGTVSSVSVVSANGLAGTVATATSTPAITLSTTVTGVLKGNGTAISAATAGTDYQAPLTLTTTGTSGAATLVGNTLNIPQYSGGGGATGIAYVVETPSGTVNGTNTTFTLANTPSASSAVVFWLNGVAQFPTADFTMSGATATFVVAPITGTEIRAGYTYGTVVLPSEYDNGNSGTTKTITWTNSPFQKVTMTGNCTFTFGAPTVVGRYQLKLIQDATGSRTATFPTMKNQGGSAFVLSTAANAQDILTIYWDGTSYYAMGNQNFA